MLVKRYRLNTLPKLNYVFQGGLGEESMVHIYGPYQAGKTILTIQLIYEILSQDNVSALYIDVESSLKNNFIVEDRLNAFKERFKFEAKIASVGIEKYARSSKRRDRKSISELKRIFETVLDELEIEYDKDDLTDALHVFLKQYELKVDKSEKKCIYVLDGIQLNDLYKLLDIDAEVSSIGQKIEIKVKRQGDPITSPLSKFIRKNNIKVIVIDSLGSLLKNLPTGLSDLPARAVALNLLLTSLMKLTTFYKLIVIVTNHESVNPTKDNIRIYYGGIAVGYSFKYSIHLARKGEKRFIIVDRAPHIPDRSVKIELAINDDGFHEVTSENEDFN